MRFWTDVSERDVFEAGRVGRHPGHLLREQRVPVHALQSQRKRGGNLRLHERFAVQGPVKAEAWPRLQVLPQVIAGVRFFV